MTILKILTFSDIERTVRQIVAENPDFVYNKPYTVRCVYRATENLPACLFGQVLTRLGIEILPNWEGRSISSILHEIHVLLTEAQEHWVGHLQGYQDMGSPWSKALELVDNRIHDHLFHSSGAYTRSSWME